MSSVVASSPMLAAMTVEKEDEDTVVVVPEAFNEELQSISALAMTQAELLVNAFRLHPFTELEMVLMQDSMPTGVTFEAMKSLYDALVGATQLGIFEQKEKKTYVDYFYPGNVRGRYENGRDRPVYIRKVALARLDTVCLQRPGTIMRYNLKDESPMRKFFPTQPPLFVRLAEVWDFTYKNKFVYTVKKVVSGTTKQDACTRPPAFEVELEVLRNMEYLNNTNDGTLARSLISKSVDLIGRWSEETETQDFLEVDIVHACVPSDRSKVSTITNSGSTGEKGTTASHPKTKKKKKTTKKQADDPSGSAV